MVMMLVSRGFEGYVVKPYVLIWSCSIEGMKNFFSICSLNNNIINIWFTLTKADWEVRLLLIFIQMMKVYHGQNTKKVMYNRKMNKLGYSSITKMIWTGCPNKTISTAYDIGSLNKLLFGIIKEKNSALLRVKRNAYAPTTQDWRRGLWIFPHRS